MVNSSIPVLGFAAFSGTGKTTLLKKLIPVLKEKGLKVAVVKHAHHDFQIDLPGKDSYELRTAGADQILISSANRFVKITEQIEEKSLEKCLEQIDIGNCDLILVEGYKRSRINKIELHRPSLGFPLLCLSDKNIIAVAADEEVVVETDLPILDLNNVAQIAQYVFSNMNKLIPN